MKSDSSVMPRPYQTTELGDAAFVASRYCALRREDVRVTPQVGRSLYGCTEHTATTSRETRYIFGTILAMSFLEDEIEFEFYRSSGPGGQKKNTTDSAVRARHVPTGIVVVATAERSQHRNKQAAIAEIARRLAARKKKRVPRVPTKPSKASEERRIQEKKKRAETKRSRGTGSIED
jgi:hypothetical protein